MNFTIKTFTHNNIEYSYFQTSDGIRWLGTGVNTQPAVDRDTTGTLVLPNFIEENGEKFPLTHVSQYSFRFVKIKKLIFPSTLTFLADAGCEQIEEVEYIDLSTTKITTILQFTFSRCFRLKTLLLPLSISSLGEYSLQDTKELKFLTISSKLKEIHSGFCYINCYLDTIFYCGTDDNGLKLPSIVKNVIVPKNYLSETFSDINITRSLSNCIYRMPTCLHHMRFFSYSNLILVFFLLV